MENRNKALIRKYIHQDCTPAELEELKRILVLPEAAQFFDELMSEHWDGLPAVNDTDQPRLNEKLKQFYGKLEREEAQIVQLQTQTDSNTRRKRVRKYFYYAAILTLIATGLLTYKTLQLKKTPVTEQFALHEVVNPKGQRAKILLPDSSVVFLGAGSTLKFPEKFAAHTREISLTGAAFFEVTKNPKKPFIIHTGEVQTQVLGTSFKIEAFNRLPLTVAVATGKVRVDQLHNGKLKSLAVLTPGQQVSYQGRKAVQTTVAIDEIRSWKDARLTFHQRKLIEITTELERWYNVEFNYKQASKAAEEISVALQADMPLNKIMKVLSSTGHFRYQMDGRRINIK